jgi:hypothetical protein
MMDLPGRPAAELRASMQETLEQTHDARLMDLEAGITEGADADRAGEALIGRARRSRSGKATWTMSHSPMIDQP